MDMPPARGRTVYSVSELADTLRALISDALPRVWVEGELSNFSRPASGHWYFTLKDSRAQLRCAMFRNANLHVRPPPSNGDAVLVRARLDFYTARGELQLICEHLEPAGEGALLRAYEELKRRLAAEGLFDEADKRPIPRLPRRIGVITSGSGAALHDILTTLGRRYPLAPVDLYPVPVQGAEAPPAIVRALQELPARAPVDVIILARGGGSLEDLWAFNDERVARAIRACTVPVVSGVGHEVDVTIADFAADLRAPTPTGAAERITPDIGDWRQALDTAHRRAAQALTRRLQDAAQQADRLGARLQAQHPQRRLQERGQRLDDLRRRLGGGMQRALDRQGDRLRHGRARLQARAPEVEMLRRQRGLDDARGRLKAAMRALLAGADGRLQRQVSVLGSLSPRAVLERGYAIALDTGNRAVTDAAQLKSGDPLRVLLARGSAEARVERTHPDTPPARSGQAD